jgi:hypothetical protein
MHAFVKVRELMEGNKKLARKLSELEKKYDLNSKLSSRLSGRL